MSEGVRRARPGLVTLLAAISILWSVASVIWFGVAILAALGVSALSWLGGPGVGVIATLIGFAVIAVTGLRSILSLILFYAGLKAWNGEPEGRSLHRTWAKITLVVDALDLLLTGGIDPTAWWGLAYAVGVLYVTDQPEARAYLAGPPPLGFGAKPAGVVDDAF